MNWLRWNEQGGGIVVATLDRPPVNATIEEMYDEIGARFAGVGAEVRVVVLTGAGRVFSAGNDLAEFATMDKQNVETRMAAIRRAYWGIYDCPVPVIAAVNGAARGAGVAFAACCDLIVASRTATFGLPEINVGVLGGGRHAARLVPELLMRRMFLTGEPVDAATLFHHGAVIEVVESEELMTVALRLAASIAAKSPHGMRAAKKSLNDTEFADLKHGYREEQRRLASLIGHPEAAEALSAAREGRAPRF